MILPDHEIERIAKLGVITPYDPACLQPSSYDVRLGTTFKMMKPPGDRTMELQKDTIVNPFDQAQLDRLYKRIEVPTNGVFVLEPGKFVLAVTQERVQIPEKLVCRLEGRSSMGRLGVTVHITAGYIDPGFEGNITLELVSFAPRAIVLTPGMRIAQIGFLEMVSAARRPYAGRYQGDSEATHSRYGKGERRGHTMNVYCTECGKGPQRVDGLVTGGEFVSVLNCVCGAELPVNIPMEDQPNE